MIRRMMPKSVIQHAKTEDERKERKKVLYSIFNEKLTRDPNFTMQDAEDAVNTLLFAVLYFCILFYYYYWIRTKGI